MQGSAVPFNGRLRRSASTANWFLSLDDAKTTKGSITATATCRSVMAEAVVVLHAFQKRTQETSRQDIGLARRRWAQLVKEPQMASKAKAAKKSTETFASVWDALADTPEQAANLRARSELMRQIAKVIKASGWTQVDAATRCGITQPRVNDLLRGRVSRFSIDALVNIATALGRTVHFELKAA